MSSQSVHDFSKRSLSQNFSHFETTAHGLTTIEASRRALFGKNEIPSPPPPTTLHLYIRQFQNPLAITLLAVAAFSIIAGHFSDAIIITFVLLLNAIIGTVQEGRANRALQVLADHSVHSVSVRRDQTIALIPSTQLVPGDIILLETGDWVPADCLLISSDNLAVDESMLTGESIPVPKSPQVIEKAHDHAFADLKNYLYRQTMIVSGSGEALVTHTGSQTITGALIKSLTQDTPPPLVLKLRAVNKQIAIAAISICIILLILGFWIGWSPYILIPLLLSLAVSIIPEGLPASLTIILATGTARMARKNAVVRRLSAVEGLANVDVLCIDKTGTLTENQLRVISVEVDGVRYATQQSSEKTQLPPRFLDALHILTIREEHPKTKPLERALIKLRQQYAPQNPWRSMDELPFSSEQRYRIVSATYTGESRTIISGAPEIILTLCKQLPKTKQDQILHSIDEWATKGRRLIAIAETSSSKQGHSNPRSISWDWVGILSIADAIRTDAAESVAWCNAQNIRVVMITGDHPTTALAIANICGIATNSSQVLSGIELNAIPDADLKRALEPIRVFARIDPSQKLRIVKSFQQMGYLTAMTGDGMNDSPALQQADIGIAMGDGGTDAAREAADLVLLDNRLSTIIAAIKEGRAVLSKIRSVISFLFTTGFAEIIVIGGSILLNNPLPLLPAQLLWLNLLTDGFLDISLAAEPTHNGHRPPPQLLDKSLWQRILFVGSVMACTLYLSVWLLPEVDATTKQSLVLLTFAVCEWMNAWSSRHSPQSILQTIRIKNPWLWIATGCIVVLQLLALYVTPVQNLLHTTALPAQAWIFAVLLALIPLLADELWKAKQRYVERR